MYDDKYSSFIRSKEYEKLYQHQNDDDYNDQFNKSFKKYCYPNFFEFFSIKYKIFYIIIILIFTIILYSLILYKLEANKYSKRKSIKKWNQEDRAKQNDMLRSGPKDVLHEWNRVNKSINDPNSEEGKIISLKVHEIRKDNIFDERKKQRKKKKNNVRYSFNPDNDISASEDNLEVDDRIYIDPKNQKKYKRVIDDLTFGVNNGECLGLLGPNGAGKTTTISMITGLLPITRGLVRYGEKDLIDTNIAELSMGYCSQHNSLWKLLTVKETIEFYLNICGYPRKDIPQYTRALMEACGIEIHKNKKVSDISGGTQR